MRVRVAIRGGQCGGEYAPKHVSGYTLWEVRISDVTHERTSVKLLAMNVEKPSRDARKNALDLHEQNII